MRRLYTILAAASFVAAIAAPSTGPGFVTCGCGLRHRPGAFHICIDLSEPEPVVEQPAPKPKTRPSDARSRGAARLYESGMTILEISNETGNAPETIRADLRREGVTMRRSGPRGKR